MSEVRFLLNLLERDWTTTLSGRSTDVPQPTFTLEKKQFLTRLRKQDAGYIVSGADTVRTPAGPNWGAQSTRTGVTIRYRTGKRTPDVGYADPHDRLFGQRTGTDGVEAPDRYDGITGETKRILEAARRRTAEFDRVGSDSAGEPIRVSRPDEGGVNYYRADVFVPADVIQSVIDTST